MTTTNPSYLFLSFMTIFVAYLIWHHIREFKKEHSNKNLLSEVIYTDNLHFKFMLRSLGLVSTEFKVSETRAVVDRLLSLIYCNKGIGVRLGHFFVNPIYLESGENISTRQKDEIEIVALEVLGFNKRARIDLM